MADIKIQTVGFYNSWGFYCFHLFYFFFFGYQINIIANTENHFYGWGCVHMYVHMSVLNSICALQHFNCNSYKYSFCCLHNLFTSHTLYIYCLTSLASSAISLALLLYKCTNIHTYIHVYRVYGYYRNSYGKSVTFVVLLLLLNLNI